MALYPPNTEKEVLDRLRRIETKLTTFIVNQGGDPQSEPSKWEDGVLYIPSRKISIEDMWNAIPEEYWLEHDTAAVYIGDTWLFDIVAN